MPNPAEQRVASLPSLDKTTLCTLWSQVFGTAEVPRIRKSLMIRFLAYRIQEQAQGGLARGTEQRLQNLASDVATNPNGAIASVPQLRSGTRLIRQWKNEVHVVNVEEKVFEYRGTRYASLSEIARLITGTRWSGPLFFGLKQLKSNAEAHCD